MFVNFDTNMIPLFLFLHNTFGTLTIPLKMVLTSFTFDKSFL